MRYATYVLAALLALPATSLFADEEEEHGHGDIEFVYADGKIDIEFTDEGPVFEGEFETSGPSAGVTDDPGFEGEVNDDDIIDYVVLGPLVYHDGTDFAPVPAGATIDILDNPGGVLSVGASTAGPTTGPGAIGAEGLSANPIVPVVEPGEVHAHIEFTLNAASPPFCAYGILMELSTDAPGIANSDPFYLVFNYGLGEETYEGAVEAFAESVPEPTAGLLLALGASCFAAARRR